MVARRVPPSEYGPLRITEQSYPGSVEPDEADEAERRGIPDAWITAGED